MPGITFGYAGDAPWDPAWLPRFKRDGFTHVRIAGHGPDFVRASPEQCQEACGCVLDAGLTPLLTVRDANQCWRLNHGTLVEFWNEADIASNGWRPECMDDMWAVIEMCHERGLKCYVGGAVSGLHKRGFTHLKTYDWAKIPSHVGVSVHRYSTDGDPTKITRWGGLWWQRPPKPWTVRPDEVHHLGQLVGPRSIAVTEFGYCATEFSSERQCAAMRYEREHWAQYAEVLCAYAFTDDPRGADCEHTYGLYDAAGTLRPHGRAFMGQTI